MKAFLIASIATTLKVFVIMAKSQIRIVVLVGIRGLLTTRNGNALALTI